MNQLRHPNPILAHPTSREPKACFLRAIPRYDELGPPDPSVDVPPWELYYHGITPEYIYPYNELSAITCY